MANFEIFKVTKTYYGEPDKDGDFEEYEELGWAYASDCPCGVIE